VSDTQKKFPAQLKKTRTLCVLSILVLAIILQLDSEPVFHSQWTVAAAAVVVAVVPVAVGVVSGPLE